MQNNKIFQKFASPFQLPSKYDLFFDYKTVSIWANARGVTNTPRSNNMYNEGATFNTYISINPLVTENSMTILGMEHTIYRTEIGIARTLIHETIHAYLFHNRNLTESYDNHETMASEEYRNLMKDGLTQFADENGLSLSEDDLEALSWGGLTETKAFQEKYKTQEERQKILDRMSNLENREKWVDLTTNKVDYDGPLMEDEKKKISESDH